MSSDGWATTSRGADRAAPSRTSTARSDSRCAPSATTRRSPRATCGRGRPPRSRRSRPAAAARVAVGSAPSGTRRWWARWSSRSSSGRACSTACSRRWAARPRAPTPEATPFALAAGEIQVLSHNDDGSLELFSKRLDEMCPVAADSCGLSNVLDSTNVGSLGSKGQLDAIVSPDRGHLVVVERGSGSSAVYVLPLKTKEPAATDEPSAPDTTAPPSQATAVAIAARHDDGRRRERIADRRSGGLGLARRVADRDLDPGILRPRRRHPRPTRPRPPGSPPSPRRRPRPRPPSRPRPRPTARSPPTRQPARLRPSRRRRPRPASRSPRAPTARSRSRATS